VEKCPLFVRNLAYLLRSVCLRAYPSRPDRVWRSRREQCKARRQVLLVVRRGGATPQCEVDRMPDDGSAY